MRYDKSGIGWGRGDAVYACDAKTGNCSDFHSYFIALARSIGIPARFAIGATILLAAPATYLILKIVNATVGLRVSEDDEDAGMDLSQHSERAYAIGDTPMGEQVVARSEMPSESMIPELGKPVAQ